MESAGARVVPILLDREPSYYDNLVQSVNGLLFPGGGDELTLFLSTDYLIVTNALVL